MIILETNRLILRTWQEQDIAAMTAINQDPKVCTFLPAIGDRATTEAMIYRFMQHYQQHRFCLYAVEVRATQELIGWTGLNIPSFESHFMPAVEIGWRLASQHWNRGYATEAARVVLHQAFTVFNLAEVVSFTAAGNQASRRVMEKIGMQYNPADDFDYPKLEETSPLRHHVLYRYLRDNFQRV